MNRHIHSLLAIAGAMLIATGVVAAQAPGAKPAAPAAAAPGRLAPPIRGQAELGYTKPVTKRTGTNIVTTIKVKNLSNGSIAGLKVDEFWYDKGGDPVTGDTFRYRKPLQPQEVIEVTLTTPVNPKMARSQYKFEQSNGGVKPQVVAKF
jgi:hypothetical protein